MRADDRYDSLIRYFAEKMAVDWQLVKRLIRTESSFNPAAVSPVGAKGLCQFMDASWREWGKGGDPFNPEHAIDACCRYLRFLYGRFPEIPDEIERRRFALASYNAGRGHINRCLAEARFACGQPGPYGDWVKAGRPTGPWQEWAFASRFLSIVTGEHARETLTYVEKILPRERVIV